MKRLLLTLVFIAITTSVVAGLKCYDCGSTMSYAECKKLRRELTCDANKGEDRCVKADVSYTLHSQDIKKFKKGCILSKECSPHINPMCKTAAYGTSKECNVYCCSTDLCNVASHVVVSVVILVSCVLGHFMLA